jgi:hypothetical protein
LSEGPDITFWEWLFGAVCLLGATIGSFLYRSLKGEFDASKEDATQERRRMWQRIDEEAAKTAANRLLDYQLFATKQDIAGLRDHLDDRMDRHERNMRDLIVNRPPVKGARE